MSKTHMFEGEEYELIAEIEYKDNFYGIFLPLKYEDTPSALVTKIVYDAANDSDNYVAIDNSETLDAVFEIFKEEFEDEFNFVD